MPNMCDIDIRNTRDYVGIASDMFNIASNGKTIYLFTYFDDAVAVMRELLQYNSILVGSIDIAPEKDNWYNKEYYISLSANMTLDVVQAYEEDDSWVGYIGFVADQVIISKDTNYKTMIEDVNNNEECNI